jgi:hypothetical protein
VLFAYAGAVAAVLLATGAAHALLGTATPAGLLQWMPYRLVNHAAPLLLATALAGLCGNKAAPWLLVALVGWGAATPYLSPLFPERAYTRYIAPGEAAAFILVGAGWARWILGDGMPRGRALIALVLLPLAALVFHRFGAACLVLGFAIAGLPLRSLGHGQAWRGRATAAVLVMAAVQGLVNQAQAHARLPRSTFEATVARSMAALPPGRRVVLAPPGGHGIQARLGTAVVADAATISLISYVPSVGGAVDAMQRECFGIDLRAGDPGPGWEHHWQSMSRAGWRELAARHGFSRVMAPAELRLDLETVACTGTDCLYRVD